MKHQIFTITLLLAITVQCSCIREEALNAECDIVAVQLPQDILSRNPVISNNEVTIVVKDGVNLDGLAPTFTITPGATIYPESGTPRDFTTPQEYTVTSEDKEWSKTYMVEIQHTNAVILNYNFEHVRQVSALMGSCRYDVFYEIGADGNVSMTWASANPAFALTLQGSTPTTFPTYQYDDEKTGKCVALTTRSTGTFGQNVKKPIAAGNLFLGEFDMTNALAEPLKATHFGIPFKSEPVSLSGSYRYTPGAEYCELGDDGKLTPVPGKTDEFNIYAVFFEVTPEMQWLDGTNVMAEDNPNIIAVAEIPNPVPTEDWEDFMIPFAYREGKTIDPDKLTAGHYSITIVMSSSKEGDYFSGAVGSTLYVDDLHLNCK